MINEMRGMGAAEEVPPGYAEAVTLNDRLTPEEQSGVIARLAELNGQASVSGLENKVNFVQAVKEAYEKINSLPLSEMDSALDPKAAFERAMKQQEKWIPKYRDEVIRIAGEFNARLKMAKEAEWRAQTSEKVKSSNGQLTAMDSSLSTEETQKNIVLAVKKVAEMVEKDRLGAQQVSRYKEGIEFHEPLPGEQIST
jgi:hypothetical protein